MRRLAPLSLCLLSFGCHVGSEAATDPHTDPDASDAPADDATDGSDGSDGSDGADGSDGTTGEVADADGDGFDAEDDCDDDNPEAYPGAPIHDCDRCEAAAQLGGVDYATIQEAIDASEDGDTVQVCVGTHAEALLIDHALVFESFSGDPADTVVQPGAEPIGLLASTTLTSPAPLLTVRGLTFTGDSTGGGTAPGGPLGATTEASGLHARGFSLLIEDCRFEGGSADGDGGALNLAIPDGGTLTLQRSAFRGNQAGGDGGGLIVFGADEVELRIEECVFDGNSAEGASGAAWIKMGTGGSATVSSSSFDGNASGYDGGALGVVSGEGATVVLSASDFSDNATTGDGGAVYLSGPDDFEAQVLDSTFSRNTAEFEGGALSFYSSLDALPTLVVQDSTFDANAASSGAGAVHTAGWGGLATAIERVTFTGNTARDCSGMVLGGRWVPSATHTLTDVDFDGHPTTALCARYSDEGPRTLDITGGSFTRNGVGLQVAVDTDVIVTDSDFGAGGTDNIDADLRYLETELVTGLGANESFTCTAGDCGL